MGFFEMSQQLLFVIENCQLKAVMNQNVNIYNEEMRINLPDKL